MPQGLEIYDSSGALILSITDRLTKFIGSQTISSNGSITISGLLPGNQLFAIFFEDEESASNLFTTKPAVVVSSSSISWNYVPYTGQPNASGKLVYGQY